ncbi:glycoside hydrolase [Azospirillum halopraeferens]|uniref:glycoside hydrolase family 17 protein n=1 Tax=Azospirillum halopraeferens TaxID=34010 RepID=UPI0003F6D25B|nr:glycoside hydrolase [Azospirillum halopraeferens]
MRILSLILVLALAGLAHLAAWSLPNRPVPLDPLPSATLKSVSYAPFRDGQSPLTGELATPAQIDEDLEVLSRQVSGIRTYTSLEGLQVVPELARRHGLQVTMGAWLSSRTDKNEEEIASLIELANRYPDVITRVIVGNEVLLRGELTPERLSGYIRRVRAAIAQPVSYADVWEWWLKYPQMADEVDYLTIHLLPYWEDIPAGVEKAAEHIVWSYRAIAERFPGKPILVGETGWPTAGRARGPAAPGLVAKARFVNLFVRLAEREGFDYNVIEAFDQNWKQKLEGTVGGHWGLYTVDRAPKFPLAGPVVENPRWPLHAGIALAAGFGLMAVLAAAGPPLSLPAFAALAVLTQGVAGGMVHAAAVALHWNYYPQDVALGAAMLVLSGALAAALLAAARRLVGGGTAAGALAGLGRGTAALLALVAVVWSLLIVFDGRYRDFPAADYPVPVFGLLALGLIGMAVRPAGTGRAAAFAAATGFRDPRTAAAGSGRLDAWLARGLILAAVLIVLAEGLLPVDAPLRGWLRGTGAAPLSAIDWTAPNREALTWALLQGLLAVPFAVRARLARRARGAEAPPDAAAAAAR